jgi:hypothetical protein
VPVQADGNTATVDGKPILQNVFVPGAVGDNASVNVGAYFGLWAKDNTDNNVWFTQSKFNRTPAGSSLDTDFQHFAIMRDKNLVKELYIGIEDLPKSGSDFDYQDKIVSMSGGSGGVVPLPGAFLLLGAGLARLVAYKRRTQA